MSSIETTLKEAPLRRIGLPSPVLVGRGATAGDVVARMQRSRASAVLVLEEDGRLAGIFTERDYLDRLALPETRARDRVDDATPIDRIMTPLPRSLSPDRSLGEAIRLMTEGGYRHIPLVEEGGRVFGLLSAGDAVQYIAEHFPEVCNQPPRGDGSIRSREGG